VNDGAIHTIYLNFPVPLNSRRSLWPLLNEGSTLFLNISLAISVVLMSVTMMLRVYSTLKELSLLCVSHEGTVIRFTRRSSGKKPIGGECSRVVAGLSHM
jgi:hypothetical protein